MPCVVDVGSIVGAVSVIFTTSPPACAWFSFWNTGVVRLTPTFTPPRSSVMSA
jgi:hypothetical protein